MICAAVPPMCSVGRDRKPDDRGGYCDKHAGITVARTARESAVARLPRTTLEAGSEVGARLTKAEGFSAVVPFQAPQPSAPRSHTVTVAEQPRSGKLRHDRGDRAAGAQREDRYERQSSKQSQ